MDRLFSLHPFALTDVAEFSSMLAGGDCPAGIDAQDCERARSVANRLDSATEAEFNWLLSLLARWLTTRHLLFVSRDTSLTSWEVLPDQGISMLLRPPARMLAETGIDLARLRRMPIRLSPLGETMGGAIVPARLIPQLLERLEARLEPNARRLYETDIDPVMAIGHISNAARFAVERDLGLYEAQQVFSAAELRQLGDQITVVSPNRAQFDPALIERIENAIQPPREPGFFTRMLGRFQGGGDNR